MRSLFLLYVLLRCNNSYFVFKQERLNKFYSTGIMSITSKTINVSHINHFYLPFIFPVLVSSFVYLYKNKLNENNTLMVITSTEHQHNPIHTTIIQLNYYFRSFFPFVLSLRVFLILFPLESRCYQICPKFIVSLEFVTIRYQNYNN